MTLDKLKGYKTILVAALLFLYALASFLGVDIPKPDGEQALGASAVIMAILRFVTTGPVGGKGTGV